MFKNSSALGAFGEFVYQQFCEANGFVCERTNYCHTDFLVKPNREAAQIYVDVKTTQGAPHEYRGKRYHSEIAYDSITVNKDIVNLIPDKKSPFKAHEFIEIGNTKDLYQKWRNTNKKNKRNDSTMQEDEFLKLKVIFSKTKYPKIRIVERGDASQKRWTGTVDNLPGSDTTIKRSDATLFIQYGCIEFEQKISRIMLFPHELFFNGSISMLEPSQRQKNKGIKHVVDLDLYKNKYPEMIFSDLESLINFVKKLV